MNKKDYLHAINEINKIKKTIKKEYDTNINNIKEEEILIKEEYITEHAKFKIGEKIKYTNNEICYILIIHNIDVDINGNILYDIGNIMIVTQRCVLEERLNKIYAYK